MRKFTFLFLSIVILGCEGEPTWNDLSKLEWESHVLSEDENERQEELLKEIEPVVARSNALAGKPASDYSELLSLADKTCTQGAETMYVFDVISHGDVNQPDQMIILVADDTIKASSWPVYDY